MMPGIEAITSYSAPSSFMKSPKMSRSSSEPVTFFQSDLNTSSSWVHTSLWNHVMSFLSTRRSEKTRFVSCAHRRSRSTFSSTVFGEPCVMPWKTLVRSRRLNV